MRRILIGMVVVCLVAWVGVCVSEAGIGLDHIYLRGDVNGDGRINISDPIALGNYLFSGGNRPPCMKACDANNDGSVNVSDSIFLYNYQFSGGSAPYGMVTCE